VDRRGASYDDHLEQAKEDPLPLLRLVADTPHRDDILPALTVLTHLRGVLDGLEGTLLAAGHQAGLTWRELGVPLGLQNATKQAVKRRMARSLERTVATRTEQAGQSPAVSAAGWVDAHGEALESATTALLAHRLALVGDDINGDLDDLEMTLRSVPQVAGRLRVKRLGLVAVRIRFLLEDITEVATRQAQEAVDQAAVLAFGLRAAS
jgi:hypothetical protein